MMTARTAIIITKSVPLACQKYGDINGPIFFYFRVGLARSLISSRYHFALEKVLTHIHEIVSEYDQEIPQSQTADNPVAPRGRAAQPSRDTRKTN